MYHEQESARWWSSGAGEAGDGSRGRDHGCRGEGQSHGVLPFAASEGRAGVAGQLHDPRRLGQYRHLPQHVQGRRRASHADVRCRPRGAEGGREAGQGGGRGAQGSGEGREGAGASRRSAGEGGGDRGQGAAGVGRGQG